jgi:sulfide dehydrogenase cytochrome subunit
MEETMRNKLLIALASLGLVSLTAQAGPTEDLARTCNACHGLNGVSVGPNMPNIAGLPEKYLKTLLLQWKSGERYAATMDRHVKGYTEDELAKLATYFSKLPYDAVVQKADDKVIAQGKAATERCETCHGATGGQPDDDETPKINGQWAQYMELEMMKYRVETTKMPHKKMRGNVKRLAEEDVPAAAKYYAAQPK